MDNQLDLFDILDNATSNLEEEKKAEKVMEETDIEVDGDYKQSNLKDTSIPTLESSEKIKIGKGDIVKVIASHSQEVDDTAYYDLFKGKVGQVIDIQEKQNKRYYFVLFPKKNGEIGIFYPSELVIENGDRGWNS